MKRTLSVTLVVCGLMFVAFIFLLGRQQQLWVAEEAQAADERVRVLSEAPPPVSVAGESGGSGLASPPKISGGTDSQFSDFDEKPENTPEPKALPPSSNVSQAEKLQGKRLKQAESLAQLLNKLHPNISLEVLPVGEAVLLRGDVSHGEIERQVVAISHQFYPTVLSQLRVQPPKPTLKPDANAEATKPILIGEDKHGLRAMLAKLFPNATLEVNFLTDSAALIRGRVALQADIQPILEIAQQFFPGTLIYLAVDEQPPAGASKAGMMGAGTSSGSSIAFGGAGRLPGTNVIPRDDQDAAMDREAKQLALRVRAAKEPEKSKLRAELEELTEKHFEHRQQRRNAEIDDMADRVDKLRVAHHQRQENKPDILKRRLADLLDEDNQLKWDDARNQPAQNRFPATGTVAAPVVNPPDMTSAAVHSSLPLTAQVIEALGGPDSDLVRLHGVWGIESVEPGEKLPHGLTLRIDALKAEGLIIPDRPGLDGRHLGDVMFRLGIPSNQLRFMLSGSKQLKGIDITAQGDGKPLNTIYGIYTVDSNKLTMLLVPNGVARPQNFKAPLQPKHVRIELSRRPQPVDAAAVPSLDIDGEWLVTLPAGFEFVGKIEKQPEGCWSFQDMRNLSGYYQIEGSTLKAVTTDPKEPREYEWLILNDKVLVLTKAPQKDGHDYRGATLRRGAKLKPLSERLRNLGSDNIPEDEFGAADPRRTAITAARRKAAEARLSLVKKQYDLAVDANKKVPGSVPSFEVERLKTELAIAGAEMEIIDAGGDPRESKTREAPLSEPVAAAKLQKAEVLLKSARVEFDRVQKLVESKSVSSAEVDRVKAVVEEAQADVDIAKAELEAARTAAPPKN